MADIYSFKKREPEPPKHDPHLQGPAVCLVCKHQWEAVAPVGTDAATLECPECHAFKGAFTRYVQHNAPAWCCEKCDGQLFMIMLVDDAPSVACASCGNMRNAIDLFNPP